MSKQVAVRVIPPCDVCGKPAYADAKSANGPWGNVCREHFDQFGCSLGLGRGQEFVLQLDEDPPSQDERIRAKLPRFSESMSLEDFEEIFEDRDPFEFL